MLANDFFAAGARLLGVFFIVSGVASLPTIAHLYYFDSDSTGLTTETFLYGLITTSQALIFVVSGLIMIIRYSPKAGDLSSQSSIPAASLVTGIQLLGLYFSVYGLISLATATAAAIVMKDGFSLGTRQLLSSGLYASSGLFLAFKAPVLVGLMSSAQPTGRPERQAQTAQPDAQDA